MASSYSWAHKCDTSVTSLWEHSTSQLTHRELTTNSQQGHSQGGWEYGGQNPPLPHWLKFFGNFYQNSKMTLGRISKALPHPQNPLLRPFLAMPLTHSVTSSLCHDDSGVRLQNGVAWKYFMWDSSEYIMISPWHICGIKSFPGYPMESPILQIPFHSAERRCPVLGIL